MCACIPSRRTHRLTALAAALLIPVMVTAAWAGDKALSQDASASPAAAVPADAETAAVSSDRPEVQAPESGPDPLAGMSPKYVLPAEPPEQVFMEIRDGVLRTSDCCPMGGFVNVFPIDSFFHGNVIALAAEAKLIEIRVELDFVGPANITFAVYRQRPEDLMYVPLRLLLTAQQGAGRKYYSSGPINVDLIPLVDGMSGEPVNTFFAVGVGWGNEIIDFGRDSQPYPRPYCMGTVRGYWGKNQNPPPPTSTDPISIPSLFTGGVMSMELCFQGPPGACCYEQTPGSGIYNCTLTDDRNECEAVFDGSFTDGGIECDQVSCPLPRGSCCYGGSSCAFLDEYACIDVFEGQWELGRNCVPYNPCGPPSGACCLVDGSCMDQMVQGDCLDLNGVYQGDFTLCGEVNCPVKGACCVPGGGCQHASEANCEALQGEFQGDGTNCQNEPEFPYDPCSTVRGACCLYDGTCFGFVTEYECWDNPTGTPGNWNPGESCAGAACGTKVLGACCQGTTTCDDTILDDCYECLDLTTTGQSCPGGYVPANSTECPDAGSFGACRRANRTWYQGRPCMYEPCKDVGQVGACCVLGDCVIANSVTCEEELEGTYFDAGTLGFTACSAGIVPDDCAASAMTGACCYSSNGAPECAIMTAGECSAKPNGYYVGDGVACSGLACAQGICCDMLDQCTVERKLDCEALGSEPGAPGTTCPAVGPNPCLPSGACCFNDGSCEVMNEGPCILAGGIYQGDDIPCLADLCPPRGACCYDITGPGGTVILACEDDVEEDDCLTRTFGSFGGANSVCEANSCQEGACCALDGTCSRITRLACGASATAEFQGAGSSCGPDTCDVRGACCLDAGTAGFVCELISEEECNTNGGLYRGDMVLCGEDTCAFAACCMPNGQCEDMFPEDCTAAGGTPGEIGQLCEPEMCTPGACCIPNCVVGLHLLQCQAAGGAFAGPGTSCSPNPCNMGSCCHLDGSCESDLIQGECEAIGGAVFNPAGTCDPNTCPDVCATFVGLRYDFDGDGDTDLEDYAAFQRCFGNSPSDECMCAFDVNEDGRINLTDYASFLTRLSGPADLFGSCCHLDGTCDGNVLLQACQPFGGAVFTLGGTCQPNTCPDVCGTYSSLPPDDFDGDGDVDLADFAEFQLCFGSNPSDQCMCVFDSDENGAIELDDFAGFWSSLETP